MLEKEVRGYCSDAHKVLHKLYVTLDKLKGRKHKREMMKEIIIKHEKKALLQFMLKE